MEWNAPLVAAAPVARNLGYPENFRVRQNPRLREERPSPFLGKGAGRCCSSHPCESAARCPALCALPFVRTLHADVAVTVAHLDREAAVCRISLAPAAATLHDPAKDGGVRKAPAVAPIDLRNMGVGCLVGQLMVALVMVFTAGPSLSLTLGKNVEAARTYLISGWTEC